jgi:cytoskeletal protein RodZ
MQKLKDSQSGAAHLIVILLVVAIAVIGFVGWKVLGESNESADNKKTNTSNPTPNTSKPMNSNKSTNDQTTTTPDASSEYLVIKEWGVKIKLEDAEKITYVMSGTPNGAPNADMATSSAALRLKDSVTNSENCRALGMSVSQLTSATNATKIDDYYYGFEGVGNDACGDNTIDALKEKITSTEFVNSAISKN